MRTWNGIDPGIQSLEGIQENFNSINKFLKDVSRNLSPNTQSSMEGTGRFVDASYVTIQNNPSLRRERRLTVSAPLILTDSGPNSTVNLSADEQVTLGPLVSVVDNLATFTNLVGDIKDSGIPVGSLSVGPGVSVVNSIPTFSNTTGDIQDPNDWQINASTHLIPTVHNTSDIGLTGTRPRDFWLGRNADIAGETRGVGHSMFGAGSADIGFTSVSPTGIMVAAEDMSDVSGLQAAILGGLGANSDAAGGSVTACQFTVAVASGYDPDAGGGNAALYGNLIEIVGSAGAGTAGTLDTLAGLNVTVSPDIHVDLPVTTVAGINIATVDAISSVPVFAYGVVVRQLDTGSTESAAFAGLGNFKIATTNKLQWGRAIGTASTNSMRARTSAGSNIVMELASVDEYEWSTTSFFPVTNGGNGLGKDGNGFADVWLKDSAASFELRHVATVTGISADRTVTEDTSNTSQTWPADYLDFLFGDGSDGSVTISGNTTLTQDMYYSALTVNSGITLTLDGYAVFVRGTLTNVGTISADGGAGGNASGATGGVGQAGNTDRNVGGSSGGTAGATAVIGTAGTQATAPTAGIGMGGTGGAGGAGGNAIINNGGATGTATTQTLKKWRHLTARHYYAATATVIQGGTGGRGGSSGGGDGVGVGGGGGGGASAGAVACVMAMSIVNSGTIRANGGVGGNGGAASGAGDAGGGGGGAGGGGGWVILGYKTIPTVGTIQANGGAGGSGGAAVGAGTAGTGGGSGSAGVVLRYDCSKLEWI